MATATTATPVTFRTMADVLKRLGDVPAKRVRMKPIPGTATEQDVIDIKDRENRLCELVDGVLVEKPMGYPESLLALVLGSRLLDFVDTYALGLVNGEAGFMQLSSGLVRIPDVSYVSWDRLPGRKVPKKPIPKLAPNLAVEILSKSNTRREMAQKLREYLSAGVELVWFVDPRKRIVTVYTAMDEFTVLTEDDELDGGAVLPGFRLGLKEFFARLD